MTDAMTHGMYLGAAIGIAVTAMCLVIAFTRRGSVRTHRIGRRVLELQVAASPAEAFTRLLSIAAPYRIDDSVAAEHLLVMSSRPTFASWGFFYPIAIDARPEGGSILRIGIQSKVFQWGPIVTKAHRNCVAAIQAHFGIPKARVA